jgi:tetratricopeptide (TPR) repeat protein
MEQAQASREETADQSAAAQEPAIAIQPWDPDTPYLKALRAASPDERWSVYVEQRLQHGGAPAFYLDCADFFLKEKDTQTGLQVLSNVAELELENAALLRVLAHRLAQLDSLDLAADLFERVLALRPDEPQSARDLALVLARRAQAAPAAPSALGDYRRAVDLLYRVVAEPWERFPEIQVVALMELNRLLPVARAAGLEDAGVDLRLVRLLDVDLRIVLTWDADLTDMDLWVVEPSGEKCDYSHNRTTIGGRMSRDFTQGYGPEEYVVRKAMPGQYKIQANFYGSSQVTLTGGTTVQATVITHFGRPNEERKSLTLRLANKREVIDVGAIAFGE